jgi:hypothetical protein
MLRRIVLLCFVLPSGLEPETTVSKTGMISVSLREQILYLYHTFTRCAIDVAQDQTAPQVA